MFKYGYRYICVCLGTLAHAQTHVRKYTRPRPRPQILAAEHRLPRDPIFSHTYSLAHIYTQKHMRTLYFSLTYTYIHARARKTCFLLSHTCTNPGVSPRMQSRFISLYCFGCLTKTVSLSSSVAHTPTHPPTSLSTHTHKQNAHTHAHTHAHTYTPTHTRTHPHPSTRCPCHMRRDQARKGMASARPATVVLLSLPPARRYEEAYEEEEVYGVRDVSEEVYCIGETNNGASTIISCSVL